MERLCFLSPSLEAARTVVTDLKENGIPAEQLHVIASPGLNIDQAFDEPMSRLTRTAGIGGAGGLALAVLLRAVAPKRLGLGGGAILSSALLGAGVAGLLGYFAGGSAKPTQSADLQKLEAELEQGKVLVIADVQANEKERYRALVDQYEPGTRPTSIDPPAQLIPH